MMKRGGTAIFLLGVSGLSLSIAMFVDNLNSKEAAKAEPESEDKESQTEPEPDEDEEDVEAEPPKLSRQTAVYYPAPSYRDLYLAEQKQKEAEYWSQHAKDFRYKGNGTDWDKQAYFMREAYRRAREAVPVSPQFILEAKLRKLEEEEAAAYQSDSTVNSDDVATDTESEAEEGSE